MDLTIRGAQPSAGLPNTQQKHCIRVNKIYDWVTLSASSNQDIIIPTDCLDQIQNITNLGIECCIDPTVVPNPTITVISINRNLPENAAVVTLQLMIAVQLLIFDADNTTCPLCCINGVIPVRITVVLCLPEPLDASNISCEVNGCSAIGYVVGDGIDVSFDFCLEIVVDADVKLLVSGNFCQPRPNISIPQPNNNICFFNPALSSN